MFGINVAGTMDLAFNMLLVLFGLLIFGGVMFYVFYITKFKHEIVIREVISGRKIIHKDTFREFKDGDGVEWYHLRKAKHKIPKAPESAIEINTKGRKFIEVYRLSGGDYIFAKDTVQPIPQELLDITNKYEKERKIKEWAKENRAINAFQPLTTKQRLILINSILQAQGRKRKPWQEYILPVAGITAVVIIVVSLMIFWGDIAKPVIDSNRERTVQLKIQKETLELINQINNDVQLIKNEKTDIKEAPD